MLKYIKVKNFLSFKKETEINFESDLRWKKIWNVFKIWDDVLMKNMLIYWANASWKSNILKVVNIIKLVSLRNNLPKNLITPFLLNQNSEKESSFFEICFFIKDREFIYNFEIYNWKILKENLFEIKNINNKTLIFERNNLKIKPWKWFEKELEKWKDKVKENSSVISVLKEWNWKLAWKDIDYFFRKIHVIWPKNGTPEWLTVDLLEIEKNIESKKFLLRFLQFADINIEDINIERKPIPENILKMLEKDSRIGSDILDEIKNKWNIEIKLWHKIEWIQELKYFNLNNESDWTRKLFSILWPIVDTIFNEWVLFVDEIENNLHLHILQEIIKFINSDIRWKKYQFIFTTHNIWLMDLKVLKKSQIWIVEKNKDWESEFYTLFDFDKVREWMDIKKYFNAWIYWWVPNIWDFKSLLNNFELWVEEKK